MFLFVVLLAVCVFIVFKLTGEGRELKRRSLCALVGTTAPDVQLR